MTQVWDDIVASGWGPDYAAGSVLTMIRVTGDLTAARWYYARLHELMRGELLPSYVEVGRSSWRIAVGRAAAVLDRLNGLLTDDEKERIRCA